MHTGVSVLALPVEMKQAIFSKLPDVSSVVYLHLAHSSFYHCLQDAKSVILSHVLQSQIHSDVAFDALAALKSSKLGSSNLTWSKEDVRKLMTVYDGIRVASLSRHWSFRDALYLDNLHNHVEYFARGFITTALNPKTDHNAFSVNAQTASSSEQHRVERTLYRFELYCNLFRKRERKRRELSRNRLNPEERFIHREQHQIFFERFPPWENEQFASIREYLFKRLSIPYDDVAEHDIEQARFEDLLDEDRLELKNSYKEHHLSLGLEHLHKVANATIFNDRRQLLSSTSGDDSGFLDRALEPTDLGSATEVLDFGTHKASVVHDARVADSGPGPQLAWFWAHTFYDLFMHSYNYHHQGHAFLRRQGYVFWDLDRLEKSDLLEKPFTDLALTNTDYDDDLIGEGADHDDMEDSYNKRHQIWKRGGRGWWSRDDETRVQWPVVKAPKD